MSSRNLTTEMAGTLFANAGVNPAALDEMSNTAQADWKDLRENWAKTSGMHEAVEAMRQYLENNDALPFSVIQCLVQGPQEAISSMQNVISGVALVAALFLVGNIASATVISGFAELADPDPTNHAFDESDFVMGPYACSLAFCGCNVLSIGSFMVVIAFYIRSMATTTRAAARDADVFLFFLRLSKDFNAQLNNKGFLFLTFGLVMQGLAILFGLVGARLIPLHTSTVVAALIAFLPCCLVFFTGDLKVGQNASTPVTESMKKNSKYLINKVYAPLAELDDQANQ